MQARSSAGELPGSTTRGRRRDARLGPPAGHPFGRAMSLPHSRHNDGSPWQPEPGTTIDFSPALADQCDSLIYEVGACRRFHS